MSEVKEEVKEVEVAKNPLEQAKELLAEIRKEKEERAKILEQEQQLEVERLLSGRSEAGNSSPAVSKEEEVKERVNKMLAGTGRQI
tara:strand:- start:1298 stop:1555 length:258 start_codon:yes stop_codon:yes gene_type:complete